MVTFLYIIISQTLGHVQIFDQILAYDRGFTELIVNIVLKCDQDCSLTLLSYDDCQLYGSVSSASM